MPMSEEIQDIILAAATRSRSPTKPRAGINDLRASALIKVKHGIISLAEINRVTKLEACAPT